MEHPTYIAKIKVVEKRWHGWSEEGANIPPKESVYEKPSGSRLIISTLTHKMVGVWGEKDQQAENAKRCDYVQKEGFRIFISGKLPNIVNFNPERTLEPVKGEIFPVKNDLPSKKEKLKVGESFKIEPFSMDVGVKYEVSLLDIFTK
jgi:hypothetical protein